MSFFTVAFLNITTNTTFNISIMKRVFFIGAIWTFWGSLMGMGDLMYHLEEKKMLCHFRCLTQG